MPLHTLENAITVAKVGFTAVTVGFGTFFFMDERHASKMEVVETQYRHKADMIHAELESLRQIKLSDSTRYAEVAKFYVDRMKDGEQLSAAEKKRLELVMAQQERISEALKDAQ